MSIRQFFHLGVSLSMILLGIVFLYGGSFFANKRDNAVNNVAKIRSQIKVAKTLVNEGQVDTYSDLLVQLSGYCDQVKIPRSNCRVNSQGAVDKGDYTSRKYVINLSRMTMPWVVQYFSKLENLPSNVRVIRSNLRREVPRVKRGKSQIPLLSLNLEMNEITFKQT